MENDLSIMKFKKLLNTLISLFLVLISNIVLGEWSLYFKDNTSETYIDYSSKTVKGDKVQYVQYTDFPFGVPKDLGQGMSIKYLSEIDCKEETIRSLYLVNYRDIKLQGGVLSNHDLTSTSPSKIIPNTGQSSLMKKLCN